MADEYRVVAADGKEYGPASLETIGEWIRQRRIVAGSRVRKGAGPEVDAASLPEIAALLAAQAGAAALPRAAAAPPSEFRVDEFIGRAWIHFRDNWPVLVGMFLVFVAIIATCRVFRLGFPVNVVIDGPILLGIWRAVLGMVDGRKPAIGMMFEGFDRFLDAFLAYIVMAVLIALGFVCLIVPGVILMIMWQFTYAVLGETRMGFWDAMHESAVLTEGHRGRLFLLMLVSFALVVLGSIPLGLGLPVAWPLVVTASAIAYRFLQRTKGRPARA